MRLEGEHSKGGGAYLPSPTSGGPTAVGQMSSVLMAPIPGNPAKSPGFVSCPVWLLGGRHSPLCLWKPLVCGPGWRGVSGSFLTWCCLPLPLPPAHKASS